MRIRIRSTVTATRTRRGGSALLCDDMELVCVFTTRSCVRKLIGRSGLCGCGCKAQGRGRRLHPLRRFSNRLPSKVRSLRKASTPSTASIRMHASRNTSPPWTARGTCRDIGDYLRRLGSGIVLSQPHDEVAILPDGEAAHVWGPRSQPGHLTPSAAFRVKHAVQYTVPAQAAVDAVRAEMP